MDTTDERVGKVFIVSPLDENKEPLPLYFVVTQDGLLLHMEQMDEMEKEVVQQETGKILSGLDSSRGRFNEFIKNKNNYKIHMALVPPLTVMDARRIDEKYRMSGEKMRKAIRKELDLWAR